MHSFVGADGEYELSVRGCIILHVVGTFRSFARRRKYVNTLTTALARKVPQHAIRSFWGVGVVGVFFSVSGWCIRLQ